MQPALDAWAAEKADLPDYDSGSDGPKATDELLTGTLVTKDKALTAAAKAAARELLHAGIALAVTSGRPPCGMKMLIQPLALQGAIAGFNGAVLVNPDLSVIESHTLDPATAAQTLKLILDCGLDAWVYTEDEWLIRDPPGRAACGPRDLDRKFRNMR
jgi:hydroxymethylpyrimidine pyrophosphatase-like HAD family hydrolase